MIDKQGNGRCLNPINTYGVTIEIRLQLVEWIVSLCEILKFDSETIHLAVNYMDNFLSGNFLFFCI